MASLRTLDLRCSLLTLLPHASYTLSRLRAQPLCAPHVATFEALRAEGRQVLDQELALDEAVTDAQARVDAAGESLDALADQVSRATLTVTADDRSSSLYVHFFRAKTISAFKRPVLGAQLRATEAWLGPLSTSPHPELLALAPAVAAAVAEAKDADRARTAVRHQIRYFRHAGERQQWGNRLNMARKVLHGALAALPHEHPRLPSNFADQFFLKVSRGKSSGEEKEEAEEETIEGLRAQAAAQREELAATEERLRQLEAAAAAAEARKRAAARAADAALLAELDRAATELEQKRAAVRARITVAPA